MKKMVLNKKKLFNIILITTFFLTLIHGAETHQGTKVLKVGYADCDPIFIDEAGNYNGYGVSYLEEIARYTQWEYEYIFDSWTNCMKRLANGELDLLIMTHQLSDRRGQFLFSNIPMGYDYPVLYAPPDSDIYYQDYEAFDGARIGVSAETYFKETLTVYLQEMELNCQVIPFASDSEAKEALSQGTIDMMVSSIFTPQKEVKVVDRFSFSPGYICTNRQNRKLMEEVNTAMQKIRIRNPNLEEVLMRSFYNISKEVTHLYLTREEQEYIDTVGSIVIKGFEDRRPMSYTDVDGKFKGVMVDYLNQLAAMSGLKFTYEAVKYSTLEKNIAAMKEEHFGLLWAGESEENLQSTETIYQSNSLFDTALAYVRREGEHVTKYDSHTYAVSNDLQHVGELLLETNSKSNIIYYESAQECMEAVLTKKVDMAILTDKVADYWLNKPLYKNKLARVAGSGAYIYGMCLYVPKEHQHLISILNKTLGHISDVQKLYMLDNLAQSHSYVRQFEDTFYEYKGVFLIILLLGIGIRVLQYRIRKHKKEVSQLQSKIQQREEIFNIVSEHSNRILYIYDLETKTTKPWDEENAQKDILAHVYSGTYSEEKLAENTAVFTEVKDTVKNFFINIHSGVPSGEMNVRIKLLNGQYRWYHFKYSSIFHQGKPVSAMISIYDITEHHEHELAYLRIKELTESNIPGNKVSMEINLTLDHVEKIVGIQGLNYTEDKGYTFSQLLDEIFSHNIEFVQKESALRYFSTEYFLASYTRGKRELHSEWQICYPLGTLHWLDAAITLIEDPYNQDIKLFLSMQDITDKKIKQLEIRERSEKDGMTGVYNRKTAEDLICNNLKKRVPGIFLLVDMDRLKKINDELGHKEGDKAIKGMANILKDHFHAKDIIGRIGGDEFVVYLPGAAQHKETISEFFNKLIKKLNTITVGERNDVAISCSIGCTIEQENSTYESLYHQADLALYQVKKNGKNNFAFYSPDFGEDNPKSS